MARLIRKKSKVDSRKKNRLENPGTSDGAARPGNGEQNTVAVISPPAAAPVKKEPLARKPLTYVKTPLESQKKNVVQQGIQFLREVKTEFKKVTWPSRKQTVGSTAVVLVLVLLISAFLGVIDIGLSSLMDLLL